MAKEKKKNETLLELLKSSLLLLFCRRGGENPFPDFLALQSKSFLPPPMILDEWTAAVAAGEEGECILNQLHFLHNTTLFL